MRQQERNLTFRQCAGFPLLMLLSACKPVAPISYELSVDDDRINFVLANNTDSPIRVHELLLIEPEASGHYIFLYEPDSRQLQWPSIFFVARSRPPIEPAPIVVLEPHKSLSASMPTSEFMGYFMARKKCYIVVGLYRAMHNEPVMVSSIATSEYCNPRNPWDPR